MNCTRLILFIWCKSEHISNRKFKLCYISFKYFTQTNTRWKHTYIVIVAQKEQFSFKCEIKLTLEHHAFCMSRQRDSTKQDYQDKHNHCSKWSDERTRCALTKVPILLTHRQPICGSVSIVSQIHDWGCSRCARSEKS